MFSSLDRRVATRTFTSRILLGLALSVGLSFTPVTEAHAQHGGHHGHHGAKKPAAAKKKAPAKKQRGAGIGAHHHAGHASASDNPAVAEYKTAHASMMRGMDVPYTGNPDVDFRVQMIPHHQGAIDMAQVAMRHAKDPWTRQLAEAVIVEQQREIAEMQAWLERRGASMPATPQSRHVLRADSYRSLPEEPGTRSEARGQSWAPGSGIPAAR